MRILSVLRQRCRCYIGVVDSFLQARTSREKILLLSVLLFLFFIGYLRGVLYPLDQHIESLQHKRQQVQHLAFQISANGLHQADFAALLSEGIDRDNLPQILSETASEYGVIITNIERERETVQIVVEPLLFNLLLEWLNLLREKYGVVVSELDIAGTHELGKVKVQQLKVEFLFKEK